MSTHQAGTPYGVHLASPSMDLVLSEPLFSGGQYLLRLTSTL